MSGFGPRSRSDNPNAPQITHGAYLEEKTDFAGYLLTAILYGTPRVSHLHTGLSVLTSYVRFVLGMLIVLFFKCVIALLDPIYRKGERIKWGLVSYTVVMFSLATVVTAMNLHLESVAHIDNRNFPGLTGEVPPGPIGYLYSIYLKAVNVIPNVAYVLSNWLADGFLVSSLILSTRPVSNIRPFSSIAAT